MKTRARIVSGLTTLAALLLAPLAEASLTRVTSPVLESPALTLPALAPEPSEFSPFAGDELARVSGEHAASFHPLAAVSLLSEDEAPPELAMGELLRFPKTRIGVFDFLGSRIIAVERGVTLELQWGSGRFGLKTSEGIGIWLSEDPLGPIDSPNLYGYVGLRPHEKTDPLGLAEQTPEMKDQQCRVTGIGCTAHHDGSALVSFLGGAAEGGAVSGVALLLYSGLSLACGPAYGACFAGLSLGTLAHVGVRNAASRIETGQTPGQAAAGGAATAVGLAPGYAAITNKDIITQQDLGMTPEERARMGGQLAGAVGVGSVVGPRLASAGPRVGLALRRGVWSEKPTTRGVLIEERLAQTEYKDWYHVGAEDKGQFPLVDFQKGNNLVSLKTADTAGKSWMGEMQGHIRDLSTRGATVNEQPANMILDLRVPPGGATVAQPLVQYGQARGVTVVIKEIL